MQEALLGFSEGVGPLAGLWGRCRSSLMALLKKFRCSNTAVPSFMCSPHSCFLRYSLLERFFVIYNVSNLNHNFVSISSSITLYIISSARQSWIVLAAFKFICSHPCLTYLHILLTFPIRSCEDPLAPITSSASFTINRNFL